MSGRRALITGITGQDGSHLADLLRKSLAGDAPLAIYGTGAQTRTFTHLDDVADGIVCAMASPAAAGEAFNLAWHEETSIAELARICWEACGNDPEALTLAPEPSPKEIDPDRRWASVEKARELLGFEARIGVREGIAETVDWLREERAATAHA